MKTTQFNNQLSKYFAEFLPQIRQCSPKTIESYSDSFISLFSFFDEKKGIKFNNVDYKDINPKNLDDYILYLRKEKGNSNSTIGVRISALASFLLRVGRVPVSTKVLPSKRSPALVLS